VFVLGSAKAICGNKVIFDCGDHQPVTLLEITYATRELAWKAYCKHWTFQIQQTEVTTEKAVKVYRSLEKSA